MNETHATHTQKKIPSFLWAFTSGSASNITSRSPIGAPAGTSKPSLCETRSGTRGSRVEHGGEEVHEEIDQHIGEGHNEGHALDLKVVARVDRVDQLRA